MCTKSCFKSSYIGTFDELIYFTFWFNTVEIGSYPFFQAGKLRVSIVIRSEDQSKIDSCNSQILKFVNEKNIEIVER